MRKVFPMLASLAVLTGLVCRCLILGISFEYDEIFTAVSSNPALSFPYIWTHYLMVDVHPPLYNFLIWLYNHAVTYGPEWMLRWPSWIFNVTAVFLGWQLFPRYLGKTARWLFVLLLSCNFYMLLYAQHARAYSWLVCLAVPFTFLYLQIARCNYKQRPVPREWWIWYGVFAVLLCWSHYFGAFLYGLFSLVLLVSAWRYKRPLRWFIGVPAVVMVCFLPWIVPNFLYNVSQQRFAGNWWGNQTEISWHLAKLWVEFFFTSFKSFYIISALGILGAGYSAWRMRRSRVWPYGREICLLWLPMTVAGLVVVGISFKIFWLLWRYFMPFLPSLYLWVALVLAPLCKRYKVMLLVFLCFVGMSYYTFIKARKPFVEDVFFPARGAMEIYKDAFSDKDLYVAALEAFPVQSVQAMYAFYPHIYFHNKRKVYELFSMDSAQREELLKNQQQALLWMPKCNTDKLNRLTQRWGREVRVFAKYYDTCFIMAAESDSRGVNEGRLLEYQYRFRHYMAQKNKRRAPVNN